MSPGHGGDGGAALRAVKAQTKAVFKLQGHRAVVLRGLGQNAVTAILNMVDTCRQRGRLGQGHGALGVKPAPAHALHQPRFHAHIYIGREPVTGGHVYKCSPFCPSVFFKLHLQLPGGGVHPVGVGSRVVEQLTIGVGKGIGKAVDVGQYRPILVQEHLVRRPVRGILWVFFSHRRGAGQHQPSEPSIRVGPPGWLPADQIKEVFFFSSPGFLVGGEEEYRVFRPL